MPEVFSLYADIGGNTENLEAALRRTETRLDQTASKIVTAENYAARLGKTTSVSARGFEKMNERLGASKSRLDAAVIGFQKGEVSAKQMASAFRSVDAAASRVNSQLKDTNARTADFANKSKSLSASFSDRVGLSALQGGALGGFAGGVAVAAVAQVTSAIKDGASAVIDYSSKLEQARIGFTTLTGSAEAAAKQIKAVQEFALKTNFSFENILDASQKLLGVGQNVEKTIPTIRDFGNALSAAGKGQFEFERVIKAVSDVVAKEKLQTQEVKQFAEVGIPVYKILAKEIGVSGAALQKLIENGKISSDVFLEAFHRYSEANFGDAMEKQATTFAGSQERIADALLQTASTAFEPVYQEISKFTSRFADALIQQKSQAGSVSFAFGQTIGQALRDGIGSTAQQEETDFSNPILYGASLAKLVNKSLPNNPASGLGSNLAKGLIDGYNKELSVADLRKLDDTNILPDAAASNEALIDLNAKTSAEITKDLKKQFTAREQLTKSNYDLSEARLKSHLDLTKRDELITVRQVTALRERELKQQIIDTQLNAAELIKTANLTGEDRIKLESETKDTITKLNNSLLITQITNAKQVAQAERAAVEERKKVFRDFNSIRAEAFSVIKDNPLIKEFNDIKNSVQDAYDSLKDFDKGMARTAASLVAAAAAVTLGNRAFESLNRSLDLRQEAKRAGDIPITEQNGFPRRLSALETSLSLIAQRQDFQTQSELASKLLRNPFADQNAFVQKTQFDNFDAISRRFDTIGRELGDLGLFGQGAIAQAKLAALPSVSELAALAQGGSRRAKSALGTVSDLNSILAKASEERLRDTLEKNDIQAKAAVYAKARIDDILASREGTKDLKNQQILDITGALGDEITAPLIELRIKAANELAGREEDKHKELIVEIQEIRKSINGVNQNVDIRVFGEGAGYETSKRPSSSNTLRGR
ncbi:MAG: tape measure protein [Aridibacter sp.]